jgi:hypothetical protein
MFSRAYEGHAPLWKVFWFGFVPTPFVLYAAYLGILWAWATFHPMGNLKYMVLPYSSLSLLLMAGAGVAVWRCAMNSGHRAWGYIARLTVAAYLLWYGYRTLFLWVALGV